MEEIFQTFLMASSDDLKRAAAKLKEMTPLPMNSMLDRESKTDAVKKKMTEARRLSKMSPLPHPVRKHEIPTLFLGAGCVAEEQRHIFI